MNENAAKQLDAGEWVNSSETIATESKSPATVAIIYSLLSNSLGIYLLLSSCYALRLGLGLAGRYGSRP